MDEHLLQPLNVRRPVRPEGHRLAQGSVRPAALLLLIILLLVLLFLIIILLLSYIIFSVEAESPVPLVDIRQSILGLGFGGFRFGGFRF